jgi:hypothetical protein
MTNSKKNLTAKDIRSKCRFVGKEDLGTASNLLRYAQDAGFRGTTVDVASTIALSLDLAVLLAAENKHEDAAKKAASALGVLRTQRHTAKIQNARVLGDIKFVCRDGKERTIGAILRWYSECHFKIAAQITEALEYEKNEVARLEEAMIDAAIKLGTTVEEVMKVMAA